MKGPFGVGIVCALVLWASGGLPARAASVDGAHVLVSFAANATADQRAAALASIGGVADGAIPQLGVTRVLAANAGDAAAILAAQPGVRAAQADSRVHLNLIPSDSLFQRDPYTGLGQWGLRVAHVERAWDIGMGSPDVIVATIDTGVDPSHPDLGGALLPVVPMLSSASAGCDLASAVDDNSHGTHVAGIIAAIANNGIGVAGVASGVRVLPIKALDCTGAGSVSDIARAIVFAADHGARIINISLGSPDDSFAVRDAVRYAQSKGALIIAAAGNCGVGGGACDLINETEYPAAYPGVIAVGATNTDDTIATFSTKGTYVALSAPGVKIVSTTPTYATYLSARGQTRNYGVFSGTSQASPFVAGVAALALSQDPSLTSQKLADRLRATADPLGSPIPNTSFGVGRVNALRLLSAPGGVYGAVYDTSAVPQNAAGGAFVGVNVKVTNTSAFTWGANAGVRLSYHWIDAAGRTVVWDGARTALPAAVPTNGSADLSTQIPTPASAGLYTLRLDMVNEGFTWFSATGVPTRDLKVAISGAFSAGYAVGTTNASVAVNRVFTLPITVTNTGVMTWPSAGDHPVHLSYHWIAPDGAFVLVWDGARASLPGDLAPGATATIPLAVNALPFGGGYTLRVDLVQEGVAWFSGLGVPSKDVSVLISG